MASNSKKLGLNLGGDQIYLCEIGFEKNKYILNELFELNIDPITSQSQIEDKELRKEIRSIISDTMKIGNIRTVDIGVSIDYKMGLLKKIPYDTSLKGDELLEHFKWELAQYTDDTADNYELDIDEVDLGTKRPSIVLGAAQKKIVDFVKDVLPQSLNLVLLDFNIFSAANTMEVNYDYSDFELIALVKFGRNKIVTMINIGNKFKGIITKLYKFEESEDYEKLASDAMMLINKGFKKYNTNKDKKGIDRIFIYQGYDKLNIEEIVKNFDSEEFVDLNLSKNLDENKKRKINILNPFEKISYVDKFADKLPAGAKRSSYSESIGLAVKSINKKL